MTPTADDRVAALSPHRQSLLRQLQASRARAAAAGPDHPPDHPVVLMRAGDSRAQLVLLHPAGGELFCYAPLVRSLPRGTAVTGFAADPADNDLPSAERLATVAGRTLAALAREHDPGRCVLAGWSYGGTLAFEMARQHALATGVRLPVALLDCLYYGDVQLEDEATIRRRFVYDVARLAGGDAGQVAAALDAADSAAGTAGAPLPTLLAAAGVAVSLTDQEITERYLIFRACSLSLQCYRPPAPYDGPVTVAAAQGADYVAARWRAVCTGPFASVRLPGDHYTLFTPPALAAVTGAVVSVMHNLSPAAVPAPSLPGAAGAGTGQGE